MPEPWTTLFSVLLAAGGTVYGLLASGRRRTLARALAALAFGYVVPLVAIHAIGSYSFPRAGPLGFPPALGLAWYALLATAWAAAERITRSLSWEAPSVFSS